MEIELVHSASMIYRDNDDNGTDNVDDDSEVLQVPARIANAKLKWKVAMCKHPNMCKFLP